MSGLRAFTSAAGAAYRAEGRTAVHRNLPEELPLAVVCNGSSFAVMMTTPEDVEDFALGFLYTEGVIAGPDEVERLEVVRHPQGLEARLWLREDRAEALAARRRAMAGPVGCGLCGIESLEAAARAVPAVHSDARFTAAEVGKATEALRACQPLHDRTRATHAAGFLRPGAGIVMAREDVGRHNALDKLIGALLRAGISPAEGAFVMTSRLSLELVQKCAVAGAPAMIAVSAPTASALRLADAAGISLVAFARGTGFDIYTHPDRIAEEACHVA